MCLGHFEWVISVSVTSQDPKPRDLRLSPVRRTLSHRGLPGDSGPGSRVPMHQLLPPKRTPGYSPGQCGDRATAKQGHIRGRRGGLVRGHSWGTPGRSGGWRRKAGDQFGKVWAARVVWDWHDQGPVFGTGLESRQPGGPTGSPVQRQEPLVRLIKTQVRLPLGGCREPLVGGPGGRETWKLCSKCC